MQTNRLHYQGLNTEEIQQRKDQGLVNDFDDSTSKSYKQIIRDNLLTFFNFLNIVLFAIVLLTGSLRNGLFIFVIIINTLNGIYNEFKAKKTLDKLSVLTHPKADLIRNGELINVDIKEIVQDDIIILTSGNQVPTDCVLLEGHLEANESLLTGESDAILKVKDDNLLSGSFITSGRGFCKVTNVGKENYINKLTLEAKQHTKFDSKLRSSLNDILKLISIIILPLGALLFLKQIFNGSITIQNAALACVASMLGMIPEGLILLTSIALTVAVVKLAKHKTLIQELYCIETLARIDVLCLDKTGTLTKGTMKVEEDIAYKDYNISEIIGNMLNNLVDTNVTSAALREAYDVATNWKANYIIPFSSERKYSAVSFEDKGTYYLGAAQFIFKEIPDSLQDKISKYSKQGLRILVLAKSARNISQEVLEDNLEPLGIIILSDVLRDNVDKTLEFFKLQGVDIKIISGDDPLTVSYISKQANVKNADQYIDASTLQTTEELTAALKNKAVFGRVSPQQKKEIIMILKKQGHYVGMTGDGVNDILAFKQANCSIAMASGSDAAKNSANIVLLNNDFNSMPHVVNEGRTVINNITKSASVFLIKTIFSVLITAGTIIIGQVYPFIPIQLSLLSALCVGVPTFFLTYEKDFSVIDNDFFYSVLKASLPVALTISFISVLTVNLGLYLKLDKEILTTVVFLVTSFNYLYALICIYSPLNNYRRFIIYTCQIALYIIMFIFNDFFSLTIALPLSFFLVFILCLLSYVLNRINLKIYNKLYLKIKKKR